MEHSLIPTLLLGFALGLQHSLDADHLVAMVTLVGRGLSMPRSASVGALWGLGHTTALLIAAVAVILLRLTISANVSDALESGVGIMLIVLGGDLLRRALRGEVRLHSHDHVHGRGAHRHVHLHIAPIVTHEHAHPVMLRRPFLVGIVHGLAGSAALMLAVLGTIDSPWTGMVYVLVFGAGTIIAMLAMAAMMSMPFTLSGRLLGSFANRLQVVVGLGAVAFGLSYTWHSPFVIGLRASLHP